MTSATTHTRPEDDIEGLVPGSTAKNAPIRSNATAWLYLFEWYPSHYSPLERKMLRKLDCVLLTFGCLSFFIQKLSTSDIHGAYFSDMTKDLKLNESQYSLYFSLYDAGYLLSQVPIILTISRPSFAPYFIPAVEVGWAIMTFIQSRVNSEKALFGCRFLLGILETPVSSGLFFVFSSWYRPNELFKRAGVWYMSYSISSIFSNQIQGPAYKHLNGVGGLAGWRWLCILDGCMGLAIAILGFALFPGLPASKKPWWMTKDEHDIANRRVKDEGIKASRPSIFRLTLVRRVFTKWHFYLAIICYTFYISSTNVNHQPAPWLMREAANATHGAFNRTMNGTDMNISQFNQAPSGVPVVSAVAVLISTSLCLVYPLWIIVTVIQFITLFAVILLMIWHAPLGLQSFAYYLVGITATLPPILIPWVNIVMKDDAEARAVTTGAMISVAYAVNAFYLMVEFPILKEQMWKRNYTVDIIFVLLVWILFVLGTYLHKRDTSKARMKMDKDKTDDGAISLGAIRT